MSTDEPRLDDKNSNSRPTNVRWLVFALSCGTSWMLYLHRYTFALIKPKLSKEWDLSNEALGWMDFAFSFCYMAFQVPSGLLIAVKTRPGTALVQKWLSELESRPTFRTALFIRTVSCRCAVAHLVETTSSRYDRTIGKNTKKPAAGTASLGPGIERAVGKPGGG